jgi:hypothetical protein
VRLVFAPEFDIAFFGGDPDNYMYPRYDLDVAFFRVYENGKPAHVENYLKWSRDGVKEKELVFVSGNPGATNRWKIMSQLEFLRDVDYPKRIESQKRWIVVLDKFARESPENARLAQEYIFGAKNGLKAIAAYESGLQNKDILAKKAAQENKLRAAYKAKNPDLPDPWQKIADAMKVQTDIYNRLTYLERK